jgi:hypothetical protein
MKYLKSIAIIAFLAGFAFMMGCKKDDGPNQTEEEIQLEKLAFTWTVTSATLDGNDRTADWTGMTLTATTSKTYSTSGSNDDNVWPSSGTWDFAGNTGAGLEVLNRSDGVTINIDNLTETALDLSFTYVLAEANKEARVNSIEGNWVFKFTK